MINYDKKYAEQLAALNETDLAKIKDALPINGINTIANNLSYAVSYVSEILSGKKGNTSNAMDVKVKVIEEAQKIIASTLDKEKQLLCEQIKQNAEDKKQFERSQARLNKVLSKWYASQEDEN